jgi:hypothetical protein
MKTCIWLSTFLLLFGVILPLFPCDVYMETGPATANGKNAVQVKLFVELIHRRCPVDIEKTRLVAAGVAIASQGQWQKVAAGVFEKDLVVSLGEKGKGEIRVLRDCPKTGLQEEILGIVRI